MLRTFTSFMILFIVGNSSVASAAEVVRCEFSDNAQGDLSLFIEYESETWKPVVRKLIFKDTNGNKSEVMVDANIKDHLTDIENGNLAGFSFEAHGLKYDYAMGALTISATGAEQGSQNNSQSNGPFRTWLKKIRPSLSRKPDLAKAKVKKPESMSTTGAGTVVFNGKCDGQGEGEEPESIPALPKKAPAVQ